MRAKWRSFLSACCSVLEKGLTPPTLSETRYFDSYRHEIAIMSLPALLGCDLKHRTKRPPTVPRVYPIQTARRIEDQASIGLGPRLVGEGVKHRLLPFAGRVGRKFEGDAVPGGTTR